MEKQTINVLDLDFELLSDGSDHTVEDWSLGHGMVEVGASCCSGGSQTNGSCTVQPTQPTAS